MFERLRRWFKVTQAASEWSWDSSKGLSDPELKFWTKFIDCSSSELLA